MNNYLIISQILTRINILSGKKIWTRKKIGDHLGEPDREDNNPLNYKHGIKLYDYYRVIKAESEMNKGIRPKFKYVRPIEITRQEKIDERIVDPNTFDSVPDFLKDV